MKVTLITGASSGIGEEFARRLAAEGHNLVLVARSEKALHELCDELMLKHKIMAHYIVADLIQHDAEARVFEETEKHGFEVDWLINNAGFGSVGDFARLPVKKELAMIDLNIRALVGLTHGYLPAMQMRHSGTIINVSSAAGFQPIPFMATYAATKAFVTSFTEAIAEENRPYGIEILALCPGSTKTNFFRASNIDRPMAIKGQQSAADVVETALRAVKSRRTRIVSGFANWAVATVATFAPNIAITRFMGRAMRSRFQPKNSP
jgi:short-subunit dehydrogenase